MYVDDLLITGTKKFSEDSKCIGTRFESRERKVNKFFHTGMEIAELIGSQGFTISQENYARQILLLPKGCNFSTFGSLRAKLLWLTHTRPDITSAVAFLIKITEAQFHADEETYRLNANKVVRVLQKNPRCLIYLPLDLTSACLVAYADAGGEKHSQLGYVITMQDSFRTCHILAFGSRKSSRVVTGAFSGEALALAHAFDIAFTLQHDYQKMLGRKLPLHLRTDSLALFHAISRNTAPREHCLSIDLEQLRESWRRSEIAQLAFVHSEQNVADSLTKANSQNFSRLFHGLDRAILTQWIDRSDSHSRIVTLCDRTGGSV
jgi:hypothetical protein